MRALIVDCNPFSACYVPYSVMFEILLFHMHIIQDFLGQSFDILPGILLIILTESAC